MRTMKRCQKRYALLEELYEYHLSERGKAALIPTNVAERDPETFFALEYLADMRYIRFKTDNGQPIAKITRYGIRWMKQHFNPCTSPSNLCCP